jgi:hypothetical protein
MDGHDTKNLATYVVCGLDWGIISAITSQRSGFSHFVKEQQIGIVKHRTCKLKLHLPPTREPTHCFALTGIVESNLEQLVPDFRSRNTDQSLVCQEYEGITTQLWHNIPPTSCNEI